MSLIDHTDFDAEKRAALFEARRAAVTPTECDLGQHCYVRDGLAAYERWGSKRGGSCYGYCTGCRGRIRAFEHVKH
jgi:hypothetical protein